MLLNKFSDIYKRYERYLSPIGLIYGFIFTWLTLTRVDAFMENFWIVINILIAGSAILAMTYYENYAERKNKSPEDRQKIFFYLTLIIQFAYGGLFSTFFIFYIRSASILDSWLFLVLLLILTIGNEVWKKHYERLTFQISLFYLAVFLFFIYILPIFFHRLGADLFILAGLISFAVVFLFTLILRKLAQEKFKKSHNMLKVSIVLIFIIMIVFYFTNLIPPIPLSIKSAGIYHSIVKTGSAEYIGRGEQTDWRDYLSGYPVYKRRDGEPVYVFTAVYSPVKFSSEIIHQWQSYDEIKKEWEDQSRITLPISGGRSEGYRTYSIKQNITPGRWRVKVETPRGQVVGKINFEVKNVITPPDLIINNL